jgi:Family of unknown function (DUF5719)
VSARGPVLVGMALALAGAVVASEGRAETPTAAPAGAQPGVQMPALPDGDVLASTWYCAAGTAESRLADHTVVVVNPGDQRVSGTVSIYSGRVAPPPEPVVTSREDEEAASSDDEAATAEDGAGPGGDASEAAEAGDAADGAPTDTTGEGPSVADPWDREPGDALAPGVVDQPFEVAAHGRYQLRLSDVVTAPLAAALVEAGGPVVVEHAVSGKAGRDIGPCASAASSEWHTAWGATVRGSRELLVLFNPFPSATTVDVDFSTDDGIREPVRYQGLPIPAGGVIGLDVGDDVSREPVVAASVHTRSGSIVVERLVISDGSRKPYPEGLALALAAPRPLEAWAFADGRLTDERQEWIVVYNPTDERAEVDVSVRPPLEEGQPPPTPFRLSIRPGRYETINYGEDERVPPQFGHSTLVRSANGVPVVAERVQAAPADARRGDVSVSLGAAFADRSWYFTSAARDSEGTTRIVVANPDLRQPARVSITAMIDGEALTPDELTGVELGPGVRKEIRLPDEVVGPTASYEVEADRPVLAERVITNRYRVIESVVPGILGGEEPLSVADIDAGQ